jgi:ubiquinone/menaquinone biosynthesis C-methylase UbiE
MINQPNNPKHWTVLGKKAENSKIHSEHISRMIDYYEKTGKMYNKWNFGLSNYSHDHAVISLLKEMKNENLKSVLDVCCGTGRAVSEALKQGFEAQGIDISPGLIEEAINTHKIPKNRIHCGDATKLPFADKSFDATCILGALHHTAMPHTIIEEMIRVTRCLIVVSDSGNSFHGGIRTILMKLGIFTPVYRLLFRREPKTIRRQQVSEGDGPTFDFSIEEIVPDLAKQSSKMKFLTFYGKADNEFCSPHFPRLFANHVVATCLLR